MSDSASRLAIDALAAYRLTRLALDDEIFDGPRDTIVGWLSQPGSGRLAHRLAEPIASGCYWCVGLWFSAGVVAARSAAPRLWGPVARILATSTIVGVIDRSTGDA